MVRLQLLLACSVNLIYDNVMAPKNDNIKTVDQLKVYPPGSPHMVGGSKSTFRKEYVAIAVKLLRAGYTLYELAEDLGVAPSTLYYWANKNPDFAKALRLGGDEAIDRAELTLYEKALGYKWKEKTIAKQVDQNGEVIEDIVEVEKQNPPDTSALKYILGNRRGYRWKEKTEVTHNHNVVTMSSSELEKLIAQYVDVDFVEIKEEQLPAPDSQGGKID